MLPFSTVYFAVIIEQDQLAHMCSLLLLCTLRCSPAIFFYYETPFLCGLPFEYFESVCDIGSNFHQWDKGYLPLTKNVVKDNIVHNKQSDLGLHYPKWWYLKIAVF